MITKDQRSLIARQIGEEISKHRRLTKISQQMLAAQLKMPIPQLCKIEKGKTLPGEEILEKVEEALGLNPLSLVELRNHLIESYENPIVYDNTPGHYRLEPVLPGLSATEEEINKLSYDILSKLEDYLELEDELKIPHFCRIHLGEFKAEDREDGIRLARIVRFRMEIGNAPLPALLPILEQFNIRIIFVKNLPPIRPCPGEEKKRATLALIDNQETCPVICVNEQSSPESQLYHIAYELGNYFQARHAQRTRHAVEGDGSVFSRAFASEFLMPLTAIHDLIDTLHIANDEWSPALLAEVARHFGVSTQAIIWRLARIGRIDKHLFDRYLANPPEGPYVQSAQLPHDVWLNMLTERAKALRA